MAAWTSQELDTIGQAEELEIAPLRRDGTLRSRVTIWVVRDGDAIYVRSYKGRTAAAWFRGAMVRHQARIWAGGGATSGGVERDVTLVEESDPGLNDRVDAAYRAKYRRYSKSIVDSMVTPDARSATLKLVPR